MPTQCLTEGNTIATIQDHVEDCDGGGNDDDDDDEYDESLMMMMMMRLILRVVWPTIMLSVAMTLLMMIQSLILML